MKLIDDGDLKNAKEFSDFVFMRMKNVGLRTLDYLVAKAMYMISITYEKSGLLSKVRPMMFDAYKTCSLRND